MKTPCRIAGCDHAPFNSTSAERRHFGRVHSGNIKTKAEVLVKFKDGSQAHVEVDDLPKVDRRSVEWRAANPQLAKPIGNRVKHPLLKARNSAARPVVRKLAARLPISQSVQVNYCPQCGCHVHAVAMGIAVAAQMKG